MEHWPKSKTKKTKTGIINTHTQFFTVQNKTNKKKPFKENAVPPPTLHPEVKPSRISVLCQMDEATLAALPFCLYMDSHCKSTHGGTRTRTHIFLFFFFKWPTQGSKRPGQRRPAGIETRRGGARNTEEKKRRVRRRWGLRGDDMWSGEAWG